jgi:hypothetical protein
MEYTCCRHDESDLGLSRRFVFSENIRLIDFAVMNSKEIQSLPEGNICNAGCSKIKHKEAKDKEQ